MLVHDGHFSGSLKKFSSSLQTDQNFFLNLTSASSWISDHSLRATTLLIVCLWVYFELWITNVIFSLIIYLYLILVCPAWLTLDDSVKLLLMSWFTFIALCTCVCASVAVCTFMYVC